MKTPRYIISQKNAEDFTSNNFLKCMCASEEIKVCYIVFWRFVFELPKFTKFYFYIHNARIFWLSKTCPVKRFFNVQILRWSSVSVNKHWIVCIFNKKLHLIHVPKIAWIFRTAILTNTSLLESESNLSLDKERKLKVHETFRTHTKDPCRSACNFIESTLLHWCSGHPLNVFRTFIYVYYLCIQGATLLRGLSWK